MFTDILDRSLLVRGLLDFVFPPLCLGCGDFCEDRCGICPACWRKIDTYSHAICLTCFQPIVGAEQCRECKDETVLMFAYADYVAPLQDIVLHFKFKGITAPARLFASLLHDTFEKQLVALKADLLVPVPLHPSRERQRGYNQATLFAGEIGRLLDLPVRGDLLVRVRKRKPQANLKFDQRAENVRDVFECDCGPEVRQTVILVDDVVTSGATVREAKRILEAAGCDVCAVVAIAHGR